MDKINEIEDISQLKDEEIEKQQQAIKEITNACYEKDSVLKDAENMIGKL